MSWRYMTRLLNTPIIGRSAAAVASSWSDMLAGLSKCEMLRMPPDFCATAPWVRSIAVTNALPAGSIHLDSPIFASRSWALADLAPPRPKLLFWAYRGLVPSLPYSTLAHAPEGRSPTKGQVATRVSRSGITGGLLHPLLHTIARKLSTARGRRSCSYDTALRWVDFMRARPG